MKTSITTLALVATFAAAQQTYVINPDTVSDSLKDFWCSQQQTQCPLICLQTTTGVPLHNDCTASSLTYACVCSNGISPNLTQYSDTLPFHICQEWGNQCVSNCGNDATCASACRSEHPCGAQNPIRANTTASASASATASQTGSGTGGAFTGFASSGNGDAGTDGGDGSSSNGGDSSSQDSNNMASGSAVGFGLLLGGLVVGFAVLL